ERRDEWLDAAGAERDQEHARVEALLLVYEQRESALPDAVDQAEPQDRFVLAEEPISEIAAEQREEVHADDEQVKDVFGVELARGLVGHREQQHRRREELDEDVAHPVEAEALAALVADDERDLRRDLRFGVSLHAARILPDR